MKRGSTSDRRLLSLIDRFAGKRILVLGDLMLDHFIRGAVRRISPEAPVPVVAVSEETHAPGGAGNVCSNLSSLGAKVSVLSVVGRDPAAERLLCDLRDRGVEVSGVREEASLTTTQKVRVVAEHQQVVRYDRETPGRLSHRTLSALCLEIGRRARESDALIISDYGKGIVTPATIAAALRAARRASIPVVVDPKPEHFKTYTGVDCMTPNTQEAWAGMRSIPVPGEEALLSLGRRIRRKLRLRFLLLTRGEKGMTLFEGSASRTIPTVAREVFDVTGAGDTVTSVSALALACGASPFEAAVLSNLAAGVVVGKLGTAVATVKELRRALREGRHAS